MQCVATTSYSLAINGTFQGFFKGQRGLRQGDPLSPSLFALCMEYLSRSLVELKKNAEFNFHSKCGLLDISHLAYADDLILFARGDATSMSLMLGKLNNFSECSGLCVNLDKSSLYTAGLSRRENEQMKTLTGFKMGSFPFRYLGIPIAASRLTIPQYGPFINKVTEHINSWIGSTLSFAGRTELIRSVLQGTECFWLSILPIPVGVKSRITSLIRNFLWGGTSYSSKRPMVNWKTVCLPKDEGGLGLRCLTSWNKALLSKVLWDIHSKKDSLWIKWVNSVYFKKADIWNYQIKKQDSLLIKQLLMIRDEMTNKEGSIREAQNLICNWNEGAESSTAASYNYFRNKSHQIRWPKLVWSNCILPKHAFIWWLAMKERLKTLDKLYVEEKSCVFCRGHLESTKHLFFECCFVTQVWNEVKAWLNLSRRMTTLHAATKWMIKEARGTGIKAKAKRIALASTVYTIWEARNRKYFEGKNTAAAVLIRKIQIQVYRSLVQEFPNFLV